MHKIKRFFLRTLNFSKLSGNYLYGFQMSLTLGATSYKFYKYIMLSINRSECVKSNQGYIVANFIFDYLPVRIIYRQNLLMFQEENEE